MWINDIFEFAIRHLVLHRSFVGQIIWCRRKRSRSLTFITDELEAFCWAYNYFHILNIWIRLLFTVSYFLLTFKAKFVILGSTNKTTLKMWIKPYQQLNSDMYVNLKRVINSEANLIYMYICNVTPDSVSGVEFPPQGFLLYKTVKSQTQQQQCWSSCNSRLRT